MRGLGLIIIVMSSVSHAGSLSNPAFLGITMRPSSPGCEVTKITKGSAADSVLRVGDNIIAIDNVQLPPSTQAKPALPCDVLREQIVAALPGDTVRLDVRRAMNRVVLKVALSTRAEVLHRRLVGHVMDPIEVFDVDDAHSYDLADRRGRTAVIGWFHADACVGCAAAFERIADGLARSGDKTEGNAPTILAVTTRDPHDPQNLPALRRAFTIGIALAAADNQTFEELAIDDPERIHFMVIDCHGVVRFVAPVAPGGEDLDAAIDDVLAASEQAEHARLSRR